MPRAQKNIEFEIASRDLAGQGDQVRKGIDTVASAVSTTGAGDCSGFRSLKTLQKFSSVHAQVHNLFNQERHLVTRQVYKQRRSIALAEWRALAA